MTILDAGLLEQAQAAIVQWDHYCATPLHSLAELAEQLGIAQLLYKDESMRFGLGSFKALGGAYAVEQVLLSLLQEQGEPVSLERLRSGAYAQQLKDITVVTATDGNHGRSVAWGAARYGCACRIYIHAGVSEGREQAMRALGSKVIRIKGDYDESVRRAAQDARNSGWHVISDTSYPGYCEIPRLVMAGYSLMISEALTQYSNGDFTHVFVPAGVGGLAAAVAATLWQQKNIHRPRLVIVESEYAACLLQSARRGAATTVTIEHETVMAGLSCGEVSELAWSILQYAADDFVTIPDSLVAPCMKMLAHRHEPIIAGECAVAGLAVLFATQQQQQLKANLKLDADSKVLLIGTEGATDLDVYREMISG